MKTNQQATKLFVQLSEMNNDVYDIIAKYSCGFMLDNLIKYDSFNPHLMQEIISLFTLDPNCLFFIRGMAPFLKTLN